MNPADDVNAEWISRKQNAKNFAYRCIAIQLDWPAGTWMAVDGKHQGKNLRRTVYGKLLFNSVAPGIYSQSYRDQKKPSRSANIIGRGHSSPYLDRGKTTGDSWRRRRLPGFIARNRQLAFLQHL